VDALLPELAGRRVLTRLNGPVEDTVPASRPICVRDLLTFRMGFGPGSAETASRPSKRKATGARKTTRGTQSGRSSRTDHSEARGALSSPAIFSSSAATVASGRTMSPSSSRRARLYAVCRSAGVAAWSEAMLSSFLAVASRWRSVEIRVPSGSTWRRPCAHWSRPGADRS